MAKRNLMNGAAVPMEPGERDRAVLIEKNTPSASAGRTPKEVWTTLAPIVWMRKLGLKGNETVKVTQVSAAFDTQWEMGYRADMDPELVDVPKLRRLLYQGRIYLIVSADQIGRREGIELMTIASSRVPS